MNDISSRLTHSTDTAERVSAFVLTQFLEQNFTTSTKQDGSEVTEIDLMAEEIAKECLLTAFPDDGFLGEEGGEVTGTTGFRWIVDPIDGTASFARGVPLFGTLIGLEHNGQPIAGVVQMPAIGETISAVLGEGVIHQSKICVQISSETSLNTAMVCTTSYDYFKQTHSESLYKNLLKCGCSIRGWSDCYGYMLLCTGRIDAVLEPMLQPWDIIPWLPIIAESGCLFSEIAEGGLASNPQLHDTLYHALHEDNTN